MTFLILLLFIRNKTAFSYILLENLLIKEIKIDRIGIV